MGLRIWPNSATIPKEQLVLRLQVVKVVEREDGERPTNRAYDWIRAQPDPSRYGVVPRTNFAGNRPANVVRGAGKLPHGGETQYAHPEEHYEVYEGHNSA